MPKVSVIVPVYNVKSFLKDCVDSILNQTFTDFELILVDDGSTDGSGDICESYAEIDKRIRVLHKINGGLSSARNAGIDWAIKNSNSEFLLFVDSDDVIKNCLLDKVLSMYQQADADIVCFGFEMVNERLEMLSWGHTDVSCSEIFEKEERFSPLLPPYNFGDYAWNKLYKKKLFTDIRYPDGLTFEDTYTSYKVFNLAKKVVLFSERLYLYRRRGESITTKGGIKTKFDYFEAVKEKYLFFAKNHIELTEKAAAGAINSIGAILSQISAITNDEKTDELLSAIRSFVIDNFSELQGNYLCGKENVILCNKLKDGPETFRKYCAKKMLRQNRKHRKCLLKRALTKIKRKLFS